MASSVLGKRTRSSTDACKSNSDIDVSIPPELIWNRRFNIAKSQTPGYDYSHIQR
jgi:hypothetical protein